MGITGSSALQNHQPRPEEFLRDIPLELFGGLASELQPADIPQGASPFCQDVDFSIGSVFTRAGLTALFAGQVVGSINYAKTFTLNNGNQQLLILDSAGNFYREDTTNNPGILSKIRTILPNCRAQSVTQFGREYIAFGDGQIGVDIPLQWDGVNLDRVSQDGPGAPPIAQDADLVANIASILQPAGVTITSLSNDPIDSTVTVDTASPHGLNVEDRVTIAGTVNYNGTYNVVAVNSATEYVLGSPGNFPNEATGTSYPGMATVALTSALPLSGIFPRVVIAGATIAGYNGTQVVLTVVSPTVFTFQAGTGNLGASGAAGTVSVTFGSVTTGVHEVCYSFLTRQGYITAPSPTTKWTAAGNLSVQISGLAIGPSNIVARIVFFTAAGGAFFFWIPQATNGSTTGTVVLDNSSTTAIFDFADNTLLNAASIDHTGNNLFALVTLKESAGVASFADRLFWIGELASVENLLNLSFDGGFNSAQTVPLGWAQDPANGAGGSQEATKVVWGFSYKITGDGISLIRGMITQGVFQDSDNVAILNPNTQYSARLRISKSAGLSQGTFVIDLFSVSTGIMYGHVLIDAVNVPSTSFISLTGILSNLALPEVIPADLQVRVYATNTPTVGESFFVDEIEIFETQQPVFTVQARVSYSENPESFDGLTGAIGVDTTNTQAIRSMKILRDNLYIAKTDSQFYTTDVSGSEPSDWSVNTVSDTIGASSVNASVVGEDWFVDVSRKGLYLSNGSEPTKISQEIQPTWDAINWNAEKTIWIVNDLIERRLFIGVPTGENSSPNQIFMMNYRELNSSAMIAQAGPLHISYTGKILTWDIGRKWCPWNISANCGAIINRPQNQLAIVFGNGLGTNKLYSLDPSNMSDDGQAIISIYTTFFFVNRDMGDQLQIGQKRKLFTYMRISAKGVGTLGLTAYADSLTSPRVKTLPNRTLQANPGYDIEVPVNYTGDRVAIGLQTAAAGQGFTLSTALTMTMRQDPHLPIRGRV